jgi:hypothetical protein
VKPREKKIGANLPLFMRRTDQKGKSACGHKKEVSTTVRLTPIGNRVPGYQEFLVAPNETIVGLVKNKKSYFGHGLAMIIGRDMFGCRLLNRKHLYL